MYPWLGLVRESVFSQFPPFRSIKMTHVIPLGLDLKSYSEQPKSDINEVFVGIWRLHSPVIPPRATAMIPPGQVKGTLLHIFDVGSPGRLTQKEKQDTFRTLQKLILAEVRGNAPIKPMIDAVVKAFDQILRSDLKDAFVNACLQRTSFSCGLYRLIACTLVKASFEGSAARACLIRITDSLLSLIQRKAGSALSAPIVPLLEHFQKRLTSAVSVKKEEDSGRPRRRLPSRTSKASTESTAVTSHFHSGSVHNFERHFHNVVMQALKTQSSRSVVNTMANMFLEDQVKEESMDIDGVEMGGHNLKSRAGLFVDWMEKLDPELLEAPLTIQQELLFSKKVEEKGGSVNEALLQPYLLTMLIHGASWSSIRRTIHAVLAEFKPDHKPTTVLDFLTACIHVPKLWHGRDKHQPKHESKVDVLSLSLKQLIIMIEYVLAESDGVHDSHESSGECDPVALLFNARMPLVTHCLSDRGKAIGVIQHLHAKLSDSSDYEKQPAAEGGKAQHEQDQLVVKKLLFQIYMKLPNCVTHLEEMEEVLSKCTKSAGKSYSALDSMSHVLFTALATTLQGRQWAVQMQEFESTARILASHHPLLVLRNLPLLAASLKGRTDYDFSFFRSRNHMTLYFASIGIMELLQPHLFDAEYTETLHVALKCYFDMIDAYMPKKETLSGLIDRFVVLLHNYIDAAPLRAVPFIQAHGKHLPALSKELPQISSIKQLVTSINLTSGPVSNAATLTVVVSNYSKLARESVINDVARLHGSLAQDADNASAVCAALGEINSLSTAKPFSLVHFSQEIATYLSHPQGPVRVQAYHLLLKYLRYSPRQSCPQVIPSYLSCLESDNPDVVQNALERLPDIIMLAHTFMAVILKTVFSLGLFSRADVYQPLMETINVLNVQTGF